MKSQTKRAIEQKAWKGPGIRSFWPWVKKSLCSDREIASNRHWGVRWNPRKDWDIFWCELNSHLKLIMPLSYLSSHRFGSHTWLRLAHRAVSSSSFPFSYIRSLLWCAQSCPTLCNPMDCSPPGSSVHGILHARLLEWVAISFSRGSFWPRDQTHISRVLCIPGEFFTTLPPGKPQISGVYSSHTWWQAHLSFWNLTEKLHRNGLCVAGRNYLYNFE